MPHVKQLDGLRAIAVALVFAAHCGLQKLVPGGLGVTIFFFLSGYLITSLMRSEIAQTDRLDLKAFMVRRTLRIWPPLYITMAIAFVVMWLLVPTDPVGLPSLIAQATFLSNYTDFGDDRGGLPIPLWSLAVEEHFYLAFPLLYLGLSRVARASRIAQVCALLCVAVLLVRVVTVTLQGPVAGIYYWTHTRVDSILFGACLAAWNNPVLDEDAWRPRTWHFAGGLAVLLGCLAVRDPMFRETVRYSLQGAALYVIFSYIIWNKGRVTALLSSRPLQLLGLYSYTFYLIHVVVITVVETRFPGIGTPGLLAVAGSISLAYSAAMHRLVERPIVAWRKRLHRVDANATVGSVTPRRTAPLAAAGSYRNVDL
jgi:peptidoglycan/LPS O-acetylase OafA/YrhL